MTQVTDVERIVCDCIARGRGRDVTKFTNGDKTTFRLHFDFQLTPHQNNRLVQAAASQGVSTRWLLKSIVRRVFTRQAADALKRHRDQPAPDGKTTKIKPRVRPSRAEVSHLTRAVDKVMARYGE